MHVPVHAAHARESPAPRPWWNVEGLLMAARTTGSEQALHKVALDGLARGRVGNGGGVVAAGQGQLGRTKGACTPPVRFLAALAPLTVDALDCESCAPGRCTLQL
jgi:hypothetical protein